MCMYDSLQAVLFGNLLCPYHFLNIRAKILQGFDGQSVEYTNYSSAQATTNATRRVNVQITGAVSRDKIADAGYHKTDQRNDTPSSLLSLSLSSLYIYIYIYIYICIYTHIYVYMLQNSNKSVRVLYTILSKPILSC